MRIRKRLALILFLLACCGILIYKLSYSWNSTYINQMEPVWTRNEKQNIIFLFAIKSYPENYELRKAIRGTWGTYINHSSNSRILFYMGQSSRPEVNTKVAEESNLHEDIFQGNFIDTYESQSLCTLTAFKHILITFAHIRFVFKVDDSTFINVPRLIRVLKSNEYLLHNFVMGRIINGTHPDRNKMSPWYVPESVYSPDSYPDYAQGFAYLFSGNLIQHFIQESFNVPLLWIEDIFVTGILAQHHNVHYIHSKKFDSPKDRCENGEYIAIPFLYTVEDMKETYRSIEVPDIMCNDG